jgi:hypothetical protein
MPRPFAQFVAPRNRNLAEVVRGESQLGRRLAVRCRSGRFSHYNSAAVELDRAGWLEYILR